MHKKKIYVGGGLTADQLLWVIPILDAYNDSKIDKIIFENPKMGYCSKITNKHGYYVSKLIETLVSTWENSFDTNNIINT